MSVIAPVTFVVPLIPQAAAKNWTAVQQRLNATIGSVLNQTDGGCRIILACTDRPALSKATNDPRIEIIDIPVREEGLPPYLGMNSDAGRKRYLATKHAMKRGGGYVVMLDADDLVSNRLVEYIRSRPRSSGFVISQGYILDAENGRLARLSESGVFSTSFDQICGTCTAIWIEPDDFIKNPDTGKCFFNTIYDTGHPNIRSIYSKAGRPLEEVPFPAAVRVERTGDNISHLRDDRVNGARTGRVIDLLMSAFAVRRSDMIDAEFNIPATLNRARQATSQ